MREGGYRAELIDVVAQVRRRWRTKLALRGAVVVVAGSLLALFLSASSLEALRFSAPAIIAFRLITFAVFAGLSAWWLLGPLRRRVDDMQVALYLEERDPTLQAAILSAVGATSGPGDQAHSPALVDRLVEQAVARCRAIDNGRQFERDIVRRHGMALAGIVAGATLLVVYGPAYLRHGLSALLVVSRSAEAASPYRIDVKPGSVTVPRGSDQAVSARLNGFTSSDVELMVRASGGQFERVPLVATGEGAAFEGMLFHLEKPTEYFVESGGVRSPVYTVSLVDLPGVRQLDLEYHFPAYTGLPPQTVERGGDVAALRGTEVRLHVTATMATREGRLVVNESQQTALAVQADGTLRGSFTIDKQGFYRVELLGPKGEWVTASPQYTIDVVNDQAPTVSFSRPGRDTSATAVEEQFVEVKAADDFGVRQLQFHYSVNGGPEKAVKLFDGARPLAEVQAGHTLYLEELGLKPGDFVSYFARATDNDGVAGGKTTTSDIYFVQIRPFRKDYKPAQSQAQGGGGRADTEVGALSQQQRQIVAATFNVVRDKAKMPADKYRENLVFLTLAQAKLRQQVDELVDKMSSRQVDRDPAFKKIAETLPKAAEEMKSAEADLQKQSAKEALSPEQRALKLLQEAEQEYEVQVSAQKGGGGGGNQSDSMAEELADLFDLELDKLANQYEMQQRAGNQAADKQIDELAERLKELARRQQQEAERQRRMAQQSGASQSGGGASQRALADEAEQAARRLEQLMREQPRPELGDAAKRLQEAADAMRRAAANGARDGGAEAAAAERRLRDAQQRLERSQSARGERDLQSAQRKASEVADDQKQIAEGVRGLPQAGTGAERASQLQRLSQQKDALQSKVGELEDEVQKLADNTRGSEQNASRKLQEAASGIRTDKLRDKIRYSKSAMQGSPEFANNLEENIGAGLDSVKRRLADAAGAMGQGSKQAAMNRALEQARDLVKGMQSLDERMRDRNGQNGQNGQDQNQQGQGQSQQGRAGQSPGQGQDQQGRQANGRQGQQGQGPQGQQGQGREGQQGQQSGQQGQPGGQQSGQQNSQAQGQQGQGQGQGQGQQGQQGQGQGQGQQGQQGKGQGQGQGQGQQGQAGQTPGRNAMLSGRPPQGGDAGGDARPPAGFSSEEVRQFRREVREWQSTAEALRRQLGQSGVNPRDLEEAIGELQRLDSDRVFADPKGLQQLQAEALDNLKRFEFDLRRKLDGDNKQLFLSGSDEVPAGFRQAIEEYYRSLARKTPR